MTREQFLDVSREEEEEKIYRASIKNQMTEIGYDEEGVDCIMQGLERTLSKYKNKRKEAYQIVSDQCRQFVRRPFSEQDFLRFLRDIDPANISKYEIEEELGTSESDLEFMPQERDHYYMEKNAFVERRTKERIENLSLLRNEGKYKELVRKVYRKLKKSTEKQLEVPRMRIIYTPSGGQSGYKLRSRYK